jgi:hypothetical protein
MAINEASRHEMHSKLEEVLGAQVANTVMEYLPPVGWADVVTKRDLDAVQVLMKRDLDVVQVLMKQDLAAVQVVMKQDLDAVRVDLDVLHLSIDGKLDGLRVEMHREINRLLLWLFPTLVTLIFGAAGLAFAAAKLS